MGPARVAIDVTGEQAAPDPWPDRWRRFLTGPQESASGASGQLRVLDLFSGVGGLAIGFRQAATQRRLEAISLGAVDLDPNALDVYQHNLGTRHSVPASVVSLVDFQVRGEAESARFLYEPEMLGAAAEAFVGKTDVVLAGPPCQGHSTLNNKTRYDDQRNRLYLTVPAVAVAVGAATVIIENVPGVIRARGNFVQSAMRLLSDSGYHLTSAVLAADRLGWPQTRKRFFLVARRDRHPTPLPDVALDLRRQALPLSWAIEDLLMTRTDSGDLMHSVAEVSPENAARIDWLFANDAHDMPNHLRPDCHKDGTTYGAVYGRMWWDRPAPTLTTGFLTVGRGRFIHPKLPRTLTPREAARIQGFPDWFDFCALPDAPPTRRELTTWIGNAVPPILGYVAGLSALGDRTPPLPDSIPVAPG